MFLSKFRFTKINNLKDLENTKENILISRTIGIKKKIKIIEKALELKLKILNLNYPKEFLKKIKEKKLEKKTKKKKILEKKEIKKEEKKEEKPKEETKEEKEKKEKEIKRKILEGKNKK